jgi:CheY-like chemotaxis protein
MVTILVVDDQEINRSVLSALLNYEGHRVIEAADGLQGLHVALAELPDLVITDILMPNVDGYEFVRQLRLDSSICRTPVIFSSAHYLEGESQALAQACGVSAILPKPCDPELLLSTVKEALGGMPAAPEPPPTEQFNLEHVSALTNKLS